MHKETHLFKMAYVANPMNFTRLSNTIPGTFFPWLSCVIVIFSLSIFGTSIQLWLFSIISRKSIIPLVFLISALLLAYLYRQRKYFSISLPTLILAGTFMCLGILSVYLKYLRPVELTHFLLFAALGWFSITTFGLRLGAVLVLTIATGDEIFQHFLPTRIGDLHDVLINNLSGFLGALLGKKSK